MSSNLALPIKKEEGFILVHGFRLWLLGSFACGPMIGGEAESHGSECVMEQSGSFCGRLEEERDRKSLGARYTL
jgi:hypothetical protein